jgi:toxin-antitoxin system PIN domain toxin
MGDLHLPDLNVLFAAVVQEHRHHALARSWIDTAPHFATCALTESGMLRLMANATIRDGATFADGVTTVTALRAMRAHEFWADDTTLIHPLIDTSVITGHRQVPDFHLLNLAASRNAKLVTLDEKLAASCARTDRRHIRSLLSAAPSTLARTTTRSGDPRR